MEPARACDFSSSDARHMGAGPDDLHGHAAAVSVGCGHPPTASAVRFLRGGDGRRRGAADAVYGTQRYGDRQAQAGRPGRGAWDVRASRFVRRGFRRVGRDRRVRGSGHGVRRLRATHTGTVAADASTGSPSTRLGGPDRGFPLFPDAPPVPLIAAPVLAHGGRGSARADRSGAMKGEVRAGAYVWNDPPHARMRIYRGLLMPDCAVAPCRRGSGGDV